MNQRNDERFVVVFMTGVRGPYTVMYESLSNASISSAVVSPSGIEQPHPIPSTLLTMPSIPASLSASTSPHSIFPSVSVMARHGAVSPGNASSAAGHNSLAQHRPQWLHGAVYFGLGSNGPNPALKRDVPAMKLPARPLALRWQAKACRPAPPYHQRRLFAQPQPSRAQQCRRQILR